MVFGSFIGTPHRLELRPSYAHHMHTRLGESHEGTLLQEQAYKPSLNSLGRLYHKQH